MLTAFQDALALLAHLDGGVLGIVLVSLQVSLTALLFGTLIGLPLGALLATEEFTGKKSIVIALNTLMGVPTVIVGVLVYLMLSRSGPMGAWGWLFTPKGMIVAQTLLTTPLIAALSRQILEDSWRIHRDTFLSLRLPSMVISGLRKYRDEFSRNLPRFDDSGLQLKVLSEAFGPQSCPWV